LVVRESKDNRIKSIDFSLPLGEIKDSTNQNKIDALSQMSQRDREGL